MSETSTPQPARTQPPEELHWGIAYLREDFQDLRQDVRGEIQQVRGEIQQVRGEIQGLRQEVRLEIRSLSDHLDSRFAWTIGTVIAMAGVIVAAIKL